MRKVIQIVSSSNIDDRYFILAVCDDGTLWRLTKLYEGKPEWESFPAPPSTDNYSDPNAF